MGVMGGNMAPGTAIITWACDGTSNQFWEFDEFTGTPGTFLLRNESNPGECLSVFQKATYAGAPLVIWPCKDSSDNQERHGFRVHVIASSSPGPARLAAPANPAAVQDRLTAG
jgi:hypothetical protein